MVNTIERRTPPGYVATGTSVTVAAADTPFDLKTRADFICNGTADEVTINAALAAAKVTSGQTTINVRRSVSEATAVTKTNEGGCVELMPGSYITADAIDLSDYTYQMTLRGSGAATVIKQASGKHAIVANYARDTEGDSLQLEDFRVEGDTSGLHGIFLTNAHRTTMRNVQVFNCGLDGLNMFGGDVPIFEDDLDTVAPWKWVASASGTGEYYLVYFQSQNAGKGTDWKAGEPSAVALEGNAQQAKSGTLGSLVAGNWQYGDNDSIGYNTVYVRLSDDSKPDPGDVEINDYPPSSNNIISDCSFHWNGRWGVRLTGLHETLVTNCHLEGNKYGGLWHEQMFNFKMTNCSLEDTQTATDVAEYRSILSSDTHVSNCVFEGKVILSAGNASHESWSNCSVASGGTITIDGPYTESQSGSYYFSNIRSAATLSCTGSRVFAITTSSVVLGNITSEVFMCDSCRLSFNGSQTLSVAFDIAGDSNDAMATFTNCYWFGDNYTIQASGDTNQSVTITGGKFRSHTLTIDGNTRNDVRVAITGVSFRTSPITVDDVDFLAITGNNLRGTGDWTVSNINNCITISGNTFEAVTLTATGTARLAATGNAGINTAVITSSVTGGENEAGNEGVTVSSIT